jgi:hypothetical protein
MAETQDCEYVFNWKTPSGCAVSSSTSDANGCAIYDKQYGFYFDLSKLKGVNYTQTVAKNGIYKLMLCGKDSHSYLVDGKSDNDFSSFFSLWTT